MAADKSILDGTPVENKAFPRDADYKPERIPPQVGSATSHWREIVGNCPHCGAPVYGRKAITSETPEVAYSCNCRLTTVGTFSETIRTK